MKVILLTNVKNVGKTGEVKEVANGYASFLIKNKQAVAASGGAMNVLKRQQEDAAEKERQAVEEAKALRERLEEIKLVFQVKVGKEGKVFGTVSNRQIADELKNRYDITVDKRKFYDNAGVGTLGIHKVKVELHKGVDAEIRVHLIEQK